MFCNKKNKCEKCHHYRSVIYPDGTKSDPDCMLIVQHASLEKIYTKLIEAISIFDTHSKENIVGMKHVINVHRRIDEKITNLNDSRSIDSVRGRNLLDRG